MDEQPNFDQYFQFPSRRSPILAKHGIVATSQPLAAQAGLSILKMGGNAADAAVATAAALNVVEPMSTGIGGDCFCLFFNGIRKKVHGLNGSGRAPAALNLDVVRNAGINGTKIPGSSPLAVTVPGTAAGWEDAVSRFGKLTLKEVLKPAIELASEGFPVSPLIALGWSMGQLRLWNTKNGKELLLRGLAPKPGQLFKNPKLAKILREIAEGGSTAFYEGWIAEKIVDELKKLGGIMTKQDLASHQSQFVEPITTNYRGIDIFEIPPNGQGITALIALNILEEFDISQYDPLSPDYYHLLIEALRLAFADAKHWVADPEFGNLPIAGLLKKSYSKKRGELIDIERAKLNHEHGNPQGHSDTVYLSVVDKEGNACSFINSNYQAFGTGIVPEGTGFVLQNRGSGFVLDPEHPNCLEPKKRPYHTIIPGMASKNGDLWASFGVMGGIMQPQGHVQVLSRMIDQRFEPQTALNAPRFCIQRGNPNGAVHIEEGIPKEVVEELKARGHEIIYTTKFRRQVFGNGQIIRRNSDTGVLWAGSEPRCDGSAYGY